MGEHDDIVTFSNTRLSHRLNKIKKGKGKGEAKL